MEDAFELRRRNGDSVIAKLKSKWKFRTGKGLYVEVSFHKAIYIKASKPSPWQTFEK